MHKADYFETFGNGLVKCTLCPNDCIIAPGKFGSCRVRKNIDGTLYSEIYGKVSGYRFDPIEKKPLYHFFPGSTILSVGTHGCNMKCQFCQNCEISQPNLNGFSNYRTIFNDKILHDSKTNNYNVGLAFTYNEPTVWFEFMRDLAVENKKNGMLNVMVSNGYINPGPLAEIIDLVDAFNIDLKAFTDDFYRKNTKSRLEPVKDTLKNIRKSGKHLEITNLIIPNENDDLNTFQKMIHWLNDNLGGNTILHLSRYFPNYNFNSPPTSPEKLFELYEIAKELLNYVYIGNVNIETGIDTFCLIRRLGYSAQVTGLDKNGNCNRCNYPIDIKM